MTQLLTHLDRLPAAPRTAVQLEAARQLAMRGDVSDAKTLFNAAKGSVIGAPYLRALAEAAIAVAEARANEAIAPLTSVRMGIANGIDRGGAVSAGSRDILQS